MTLPEAIAEGLEAIIEGFPESEDEKCDPMLAVAVAFLRGLKEEPTRLPSVVRPGPGGATETPPLEVVSRSAVLLAIDRVSNEHGGVGGNPTALTWNAACRRVFTEVQALVEARIRR